VCVEQFELLGALVEVVAQGDAVAPALDLPALSPKQLKQLPQLDMKLLSLFELSLITRYTLESNVFIVFFLWWHPNK